MKLDRIRAAIVIQYNDYNYKAITVSKGGNPAYTGALLNAKYQRLNDIEELLKGGDLVYLGGDPITETEIELINYKSLYEAVNYNKAKYIYIYNVADMDWQSYVKISKTNIKQLHVNYGLYVRNLIGLGVVKRFNISNKEWLLDRGFAVRY